ncbi:virulence factor BrkB family protein [Vibrio sp. SCSIO 43136]|uniref:virulence factor BrkB family protein n=1 Tax=Vibrio sp. SCSIO 43136 TaxID=2819101 RepID=UPI002074E14D|nr:virulence factor BrkB family protein [Vibrio sp. SCSIO 43136]USD65196.1 virulence factor BrkB family protein [Vibrio sp. SCSIO 43136]
MTDLKRLGKSLDNLPFAPLLRELHNFSHYFLKRISHDRLTVSAGYMAYITLLSLVPLLTVLLSVLSKFPVFANVGELLQDFVINNFVPAAGTAVKSALNDFVANTGKMSAVGGAFLFVAALMLISNIDKSLNYIFRVQEKRRRVYSFSMYWMVLTLGPIMAGASIAATSYITSLSFLANDTVSTLTTEFLRWLPFLLSLLGFLGLYMLVPNKKIGVVDGVTGALIAAILFELSKKGFAMYITQFPSYQLIYGALAAIPILFVWVYLCWLIVLLGAEITASLSERDLWYSKHLVTETPTQGTPSDSTDTTSK